MDGWVQKVGSRRWVCEPYVAGANVFLYYYILIIYLEGASEGGILGIICC